MDTPMRDCKYWVAACRRPQTQPRPRMESLADCLTEFYECIMTHACMLYSYDVPLFWPARVTVRMYSCEGSCLLLNLQLVPSLEL